MEKKDPPKSEKHDKSTKKKNRWLSHLVSHLTFAFLAIIFSHNEWTASFGVLIILSFAIFYFGAYLLERLAIAKNHSKTLLWLLGKFLSVILNISISFTICYLLILKVYPESISNPEVLGHSFIEKVFNIFHFSLGNFLGMDSDIIIQGIPIKLIQIVQFFVTFSLLIFLFSNYHDIKEIYSKYYTEED